MVSVNSFNKVILTGDGSNSIFSEKFNCTYHSVHGAIQESEHVFIHSGLDHLVKNTDKTRINILEFGFGTGLNALLSLKYSVTNKITINYSTIEAYPLPDDLVSQLNFITEDTNNAFKDEFYVMHNSNLLNIPLRDSFTFSKFLTKFEDFSSNQKFDIIFFDAFDPDEQSHLWERPFLDKIPLLLVEKGILVTYSVKGSFKRALRELGFKVSKLPGPPGKREILRGKLN
jgi:tRNA U34 5-methylaminomethyl-2-thiouridine-forming methyltransferase MnmC